MALIPDIAGEDRSGEWARLRGACIDAVRQLSIPVWNAQRSLPQHAPQLVVVVGAAEATRSYDPSGAYGSLLTAGVNWEYGWEGSAEPEPLPLPLTLGYWLASRARPSDTGVVVADFAFQAIAFDASPNECAVLGAELAARADRVAMLVMGEGSTCMPAAARVRDVDHAARCDATIVHALQEADPGALGRLDPLHFRSTATGRAAWQVLAGAAANRRFHGRLHMEPTDGDDGYFVASWTADAEPDGR